MKKLVAVLLSLVLMLGCFALCLSADTPTPEGTAIRDVYGLMQISGSGSYYLENDILISGDYVSPKNFSGTLDGQGHTIVLSGATVTGGLFSTLAGATVKNLKVTEGEKENTVKMRRAYDGVNYLAGVIADCGYGLIEGVVADVDIDISLLDATTVGGMVGAMQDGALTVRNCVNIGNLSAGKYAAGMVGVALNTPTFDMKAEQCVNYGTIAGKYSAAGIFGQNNGNTLSVSIERCINYGDISNASGNQAGGMMAYGKPATSSGSMTINHNINYGRIHNTNAEAVKCQIGGIFVRMQCNGGVLNLRGNVNYGKVDPDEGFDALMVSGIIPFAKAMHKSSVIADNYTVAYTQKDVSAMPAGGAGAELNAESFASLDRQYAGIYSKDADGTITLTWAKDAGYSATAPTVSYDVTGQTAIGSGEETTEAPTKPETPTKPAPSGEETSGSPAATETDAQEKPAAGCGSSVSVLPLMLVLGLVGGAVFARTRKKV